MKLNNKIIALGTALWGWGIEKKDAFELLQKYIDSGNVYIDTATNYPINRKESDYKKALSWLSEFGVRGTLPEKSVIVKVGSIDNSGGPSSNLSPEYLMSNYRSLRDQLHTTLYCVSIHWDNRGDLDKNNISETIDACREIYSEGIEIGLSGIRHPEIYKELAPDLADKWLIQVKENIMTKEVRENYSKYFPLAMYMAYGVNMGGVKLDEGKVDSSLRLRNIEYTKDTIKDITKKLCEIKECVSEINTLNRMAMMHSLLNKYLYGIIIGPRNVEQLKDTLDFVNVVRIMDTSLKNKLRNILN